jgi:epoxyqueuosine reductase
MEDLTRDVKREALRMGFSLVGVADPSPSAHAARYRDWLVQGYHAEMGYLARPDAVEKRIDPRALMPEVRSIVVVGMNYYPGEFPPSTGCRGRVSRYAWGADYHDVMMEMLSQLADRIAAQVGAPVAHRAYVDFGPLMERELAQRAGLGWFGKNTNLIHPALGSYVFLGELLLGLELEPDTPFAGDRCGSCTACLDACPTGALVAPRVLDARRCISYLTIEHREAIPESLRPPMGDWVFGCDVCQEVCPWNRRFARPEEPFVLDPARSTLDLIELLALDEHAFRARFQDTPLWRPRRAGLLRNAVVVLGNLGAPAAILALERARLDENPLVAEHAAWALGQIE